MKHIVYMIELLREDLPKYYIGSKSNCTIIDGKIYDKKNKKPYLGSAKDKSLKESIKSGCNYVVHILGTFSSYEEALVHERIIHIQNDVVASSAFFNRSIATENNFTNNGYATYKHIKTGKTVRLPRNHPDVISGMWVGATKGNKLHEDVKRKIGRSGKDNSFYGKTHTEESKAKAAKKISIVHKGKPKSIEHRKNQSEGAKRRWENERKKREENRAATSL